MTSSTGVATPTARERRQRRINTAACLVIGDEVLGGKTNDTNSGFMARWCFSFGVTLKRIEVIADDEDEIVEAVRRMSENYDFVVTSGGIGPTHDDITYSAISAAFCLPLTLHEDSLTRMKALSNPQSAHLSFPTDPSPALTAKLRMVTLPLSPHIPHTEQVFFPCDDLWVPVVACNGNVHVLPGIPRLFERLLRGMENVLRRQRRIGKPIEGGVDGMTRILIETRLPESEVAGYLGELADRVKPMGVKVGSYPRWGKRWNAVSLVGRDRALVESLVEEVERNVAGRRVVVEGENDSSSGKEE